MSGGGGLDSLTTEGMTKSQPKFDGGREAFASSAIAFAVVVATFYSFEVSWLGFLGKSFVCLGTATLVGAIVLRIVQAAQQKENLKREAEARRARENERDRQLIEAKQRGDFAKWDAN